MNKSIETQFYALIMHQMVAMRLRYRVQQHTSISPQKISLKSVAPARVAAMF